METEVFVIFKDECERSSGTIGKMEIMTRWTIGWYQASYQNRITDNMVCANDNREDSCQVNSHGLLVICQNLGDDV